jgi:uncharacterized protein YjiK
MGLRPLAALLAGSALLGQSAGPRPALQRCSTGRAPAARWELALPLSEISGLAASPGGRLFAHGDERGRIFELDRATGKVVKTFRLKGDPKDDYEGIAVAADRLFLMTSTGMLYQTAEGDDQADVSWRMTDTGLGRTCELEGLGYDAKADLLFIPCKDGRGRPWNAQLTVFRWSPARGALVEPAITVPMTAVYRLTEIPDFRPTSVEVDPVTGNLLLSSARGLSLLEVTPRGRLVGAARLSARLHRQPEGIALASGRLYVADEGGKDRGTITIYSCTT